MINRIWSGLCMVLLLSGCGWDGTATRPNDFSQLTSITISAASPTIANGTSTKLSVTGHYSGQFSRDVTEQASWSSASPAVADFKQIAAPNKNRLTAAAPGTAVVTATVAGVSAHYTVTVSTATIRTMTITPAAVSVAKGLTTQFSASGLFSDGTNQDLSFDAQWSSSPGTFATISNALATKGIVSTSAIGSESISATFGAVTAPAATLTVTAASLQSITVTPANSIKIGTGTVQFAAVGNYSDGTTPDVTNTVTWASSNTAVATIGATSGTATASGAGITTISATAADGTRGTTTLTQSLKSLTITPTAPSVTVGVTQQLTATATFNDGSTESVTTTSDWSSSAVSMATVDSKGLVTGVAIGSANITVTYNGITATVPVTVR